MKKMLSAMIILFLLTLNIFFSEGAYAQSELQKHCKREYSDNSLFDDIEYSYNHETEKWTISQGKFGEIDIEELESDYNSDTGNLTIRLKFYSDIVTPATFEVFVYLVKPSHKEPEPNYNVEYSKNFYNKLYQPMESEYYGYFANGDGKFFYNDFIIDYSLAGLENGTDRFMPLKADFELFAIAKWWETEDNGLVDHFRYDSIGHISALVPTPFIPKSTENNGGEKENNIDGTTTDGDDETNPEGETITSDKSSIFFEPWFLALMAILIVIIIVIIVLLTRKKKPRQTQQYQHPEYTQPPQVTQQPQQPQQQYQYPQYPTQPQPTTQYYQPQTQPPPLQPRQVQSQQYYQPTQPQPQPQLTHPFSPQTSHFTPDQAPTQPLMSLKPQTSSLAQQLTQPLTTQCPLCNQQIPKYSEQCPHCGGMLR